MKDQSTDLNTLLDLVRVMYAEKIPFNQELGMKIESVKPNDIRVRFDMAGRLVGNYIRGSLHGGVISSVLDATGGLIASIDVIKEMVGRPLAEVEKRLGKMGTIDLRIDYLRPGLGNYFIADGSILRAGRRVSVTRMELHNNENLLIAVGTGTYVVG